MYLLTRGQLWSFVVTSGHLRLFVVTGTFKQVVTGGHSCVLLDLWSSVVIRGHSCVLLDKVEGTLKIACAQKYV